MEKRASSDAYVHVHTILAREVDDMMDNGVRAHPLLRGMYGDSAAQRGASPGGDAEAAHSAARKRRVEFAAEASGAKRQTYSRAGRMCVGTRVFRYDDEERW